MYVNSVVPFPEILLQSYLCVCWVSYVIIAVCLAAVLTDRCCADIIHFTSNIPELSFHFYSTDQHPRIKASISMSLLEMYRIV